MAVSKKAKNIYNSVFDGTETFAANCISKIIETRDLKRYAPSEPIPKDYAEAYRAYWKQFGINVSPMWGWYYAARNGNMDVRYVPHTLYYTKIDQHFNARKLGYGFNDKNYYSKIFAGIKQPETIVRIFGEGYYSDSEYRQITADKAYALILEQDEVICKPSQESGSGRSISFWKPIEDAKNVRSFIERPNGEFIIQGIIKQHQQLEEVHSGSINTIRICSVFLEDGVHILSSILRMGVGSSRMDNATASDNAKYDGMTCGINIDGTLKNTAYGYYTGTKFKSHPDGFVFEGNSIPSYNQAIELVKKAHQWIPNFKLVSWDIAIDESASPVLVEANMRKGSINFHQFNNGPLFGDLTDTIMKEVFA